MISPNEIVALDATQAERHAAMRTSIASDPDGGSEPVHHQVYV
jgi:hypothetical protein